MTKQQTVEKFHQMNFRTKTSVIRELLENETNDEIREDMFDYLMALQAKKEGGYTPFEEYHKKRMAKIRAKKNKK